MTREEFDKYLVSIGGLLRTYREDKGPIVDSRYLGVGEGWLPLIKEMIDELLAAGWDRKLAQSKEKFGGLRFYIPSANDELHTIISKYERKSYDVCEKCGKEGQLRKGGWIKTLCDEHSEGRESLK
jgi:hypothetical protein